MLGNTELNTQSKNSFRQISVSYYFLIISSAPEKLLLFFSFLWYMGDVHFIPIHYISETMIKTRNTVVSRHLCTNILDCT